jgi:CRP/FNR family cyclic AMP-dependent transcriptional regulator
LPNSWEKIVSSFSSAQKHRFLSDSPFFEVFTRSELDRLAARLIERRVADRQMIFGRGEPGSSMMAVVEGRVRISITSATGRELLLGIVEPGQIFGELALLDGRPRSADACALGDCLLLSLDRREFLSVARQSPDTAIRLAEIVCARLRAANDQLEGVALLGVPARLGACCWRTKRRCTTSGGPRSSCRKVISASASAPAGRRSTFTSVAGSPRACSPGRVEAW